MAGFPPPAFAQPGPPRPAGFPPVEDGRTRRLEYTPDLLPDVSYETPEGRAGWWWFFVAGVVVLLAAVIGVATLLS